MTQSHEGVRSVLTQFGLEIGDVKWWKTVQHQGMPWIQVTEHEKCDVLFLWRDPDGNESCSDIATVLMDVNSVTDHHSPTPTYMSRFAGTDVWYWQAKLPSNWRGSYQFIPLTQQQLPEWGRGVPEKSQQRQWWVSILASGVPDLYNPYRGHLSNWGNRLSALHLPDAPRQTAWYAHDSAAELPVVNLSECTWESLILNNTRRVWIYESGDVAAMSDDMKADRPIIFLMDGRFWHSNMPVYSAIAHETHQGRLPPALYVLIDEINGQQRSVELPCNSEFWQAVLTELLPWLQEDFLFTNRAEKTVVAGQSFGGLAAMYAGYNWPERFGCVLSQSGSFWWPDIELASSVTDRIQGRMPGVRGWLMNHIEANPIHRPLKVYLEAGTREGEMISLSESMFDVLSEGDHQVVFSAFEGGHDRICWRGGLLDGLHWLLTSSSTN